MRRMSMIIRPAAPDGEGGHHPFNSVAVAGLIIMLMRRMRRPRYLQIRVEQTHALRRHSVSLCDASVNGGTLLLPNIIEYFAITNKFVLTNEYVIH